MHYGKEWIWLSTLLGEIGVLAVPFTIFEENIPCIRIAEEPREHKRTKHIDVKYMFIRELVKQKKINLKYVPTDSQLADILTKPLPKQKFQEMLNYLKMKIEGKC